MVHPLQAARAVEMDLICSPIFSLAAVGHPAALGSRLCWALLRAPGAAAFPCHPRDLCSSAMAAQGLLSFELWLGSADLQVCSMWGC